ncbi:MAG: 30S ribosomal protein S16 [Candidatus Kerfeldbacteria bacterium]|nr:30S ribosomal protein S16 [Candidatus Kerfeldbacteria bacterium]
MIILRLARFGRKNKPTFRIVVQDKRRAPSSVVIETIGHYNPTTQPATFVVKADRATYWLGQGAKLSDTLNNLLIEHKVISGDKRKIVRVKKEETAAESTAAPAVEAKKEEATAPAEEKKAEEQK